MGGSGKVLEGDEEDEWNQTFSPPLYRQRYELVAKILHQDQVTSVVDFGCAECRGLRQFRSIPTLRRAIGVDIDRQLVTDSAQRLSPLISDFVFRRAEPLAVELYEGNLTQCDQRLRGIDAVTLIEVIEHLPDAELSALPQSVFGFIAPHLVVMTTPNAEFNILFPQLTGFRHPDHKFEWTRLQFEQWCRSIADEWGYKVQFDGVGQPPNSSQHVGCCSQVAIFRRHLQQQAEGTVAASGTVGPSDEKENTEMLPYHLLYNVEYPGTPKTSNEEQIRHEIDYYINFVARYQYNSNEGSGCGGGEEDDDATQLVSLEHILSFPRLQQLGVNDIDHLRQLLVDAGYKLSADELCVIYQYQSRVCYDDIGYVNSDGDDNYDYDFCDHDDKDDVDFEENVTDRPNDSCTESGSCFTKEEDWD